MFCMDWSAMVLKFRSIHLLSSAFITAKHSCEHLHGGPVFRPGLALPNLSTVGIPLANAILETFRFHLQQEKSDLSIKMESADTSSI